MLLRRAGLTASAGLSCSLSLKFSTYSVKIYEIARSWIQFLMYLAGCGTATVAVCIMPVNNC